MKLKNLIFKNKSNNCNKLSIIEILNIKIIFLTLDCDFFSKNKLLVPILVLSTNILANYKIYFLKICRINLKVNKHYFLFFFYKMLFY